MSEKFLTQAFARYTYLVSYLVLVVMLVFTFVGWYLAEQHFLAHQMAHFQGSVERTEQYIQQRMNHYGEILKASSSLFESSIQVTPDKFKRFVDNLKITERYPGIQALGYIRRMELNKELLTVGFKPGVKRTQPCGYPESIITPQGKGPEYMFVALVEPVATNRNQLGKNMMMEPACKVAMELARDTGNVVASGLINLTRNNEVLRAFSLVVPIYEPSPDINTSLKQRQNSLKGFVFGSFVGVDLFRGIFGGRVLTDIDFEIFDGSEASTNSLIYDDDHVLHTTDKFYSASFNKKSILSVYGREWFLYFTAPPEFHQHYEKHIPTVVLIVGVLTSLLLFGLSRSQVHRSVLKLGYVNQLKYQALHDPLTELPNRNALYEQLNELLPGSDKRFALLLIDLDGFKEINDTLGLNSGDMLLRKVGERLKNTIEPEDLLVYLGGDEYSIVFRSESGKDAVMLRAHKFMMCLAEPFQLEEIQVQVDASAGLVMAPEHGGDCSELLRHADVALNKARKTNTDVILYQGEMDIHNPRNLQLVSELSHAIENNELELYYQPKIFLKDNSVSGVEALIRWNHPEYGFLCPDEFIPQAENSSVITPLTLWVIREALEQCRRWRNENVVLGIAVNISARNLMDQQLPEQIAQLVKQCGVQAHCLELEVTESAIIADTQRAEKILSDLHNSGFNISIDDFGTGYTSIGHLKNLPVSTLKIDRAFISHMEENDDDAVITHSVIRLAHNLGMTVVAEGVEDYETLLTLKSISCDYAQGFYVCKPIPALEFVEWLKMYNNHIEISAIYSGDF